MTSRHFRRKLTRYACAGLILICSTAPAVYACGRNSPATPVPQFRNGVELWPRINGEIVFRPGLPGQQLPANRDTTDRFGGLTPPNAAHGHELFKSVDILDDTLFVAYSLGIQAWDIGSGNEENPKHLASRDLWRVGDFLIPRPTTAEVLNYIEDISVVKPSSGPMLVGVSGLMPFVGPTIWTYDRTNHFQLKYQDGGDGMSGGSNTRQVQLEEVGGRVYMLTTGQGVYLHDATAAASLDGCLDDQGSNCPGVYRGELPTSQGRYMDTAVIDGRLYIALSGGRDKSTKILELSPTMGAPLSAADAVTVYSNTDLANSPALFEHRGRWWMAVAALSKIQIYDIDDCVDGDGCDDISLAWEAPDPVTYFSDQFLTFSRAAGNRPFLYYGFDGQNLGGPGVERLFDLERLGVDNSGIVEVTSTGGTYFDDCGNQVDYWGEYYGENEFGLREMFPKVGKFNNNNFFYRAAQTILDVHVRSEVVPSSPRVTVTATGPSPYYQGDLIPFVATDENCDGPDTWEWFSSDVGATGTGVAGPTRSLTFPLCGGTTCLARSVSVWAIKDACSDAADLEIVQDTISVEDPRARVDAILSTPAGDTHPVCTSFELSADPTGRAPFTYAWEALREDGSLLAASASPIFTFDTSEVSFGAEIFADGFESGTTGLWGSQTSRRGGAADIPVDIRLTVSNSDDPTGDVVTRRITLTELGTLTLATPGISSTSNGSAAFDFTLNVTNATEWRWIFEDPENGEVTDCGSPSIPRCTILDWGTEDSTASYQWNTPNTDGIYEVVAQARNCLGDSVESTLPISVTEIQAPPAPELTSFRVDVSASSGCSGSLGFVDCFSNTSVIFTVTTEGNPTAVQFDWDGDGIWDSTLPTPGSFSHTFAAAGSVAPKARAIRGAELSAARNLDNGNFGTLNIIP